MSAWVGVATATMTLLLRIYSSLVVCVAASALSAASVSGRVELVGAGDSVVRGSVDFSGVVVWLEPASGTLEPPAAGAPPATLLQRDKRFTPHVLAIQVGTAVNFPNEDPIFHNAFSSFDGQIFDIGLYPPGTSRKIEFKRSGIVRVFCNIHPMMSAVIAVVPTPWFGTTDERGMFQIDDVPPGRYRVKIFHERALPETLRDLERDVEIDAGGADFGVLRISESGYVPVPHKNKYGREYPAQTEEHLLYPGVTR